MRKIRKFISFVLVIAMTVSLFTNGQLPIFATEETTEGIVLDFIPENAELEEGHMQYQIAYVKNNKVTLYEDYKAGAPGAVYTGAQGEQIELADSYTYTAGDKKNVFYKYSDYDMEGVMYTAQKDYYMFISAKDISFEAVEKPVATPTPEVVPTVEPTVTPTPEVTPTAEPTATPTPEPDEDEITLDFVPNDLVVEDETASEKYAVINDTTIRVYKSPDYKSEGVELTVNAGTVIELVTAYTYSDDQVVYRFDYNGVENSTLYNAALSELGGYPIIPAKYITVGVETVENTTITDPDTAVSVTGVLPTTAELDTVPTTTSELPAGTDTTDISENTLFYDFTLSNGGAYFEPSSTVKVTFPQANINFVQGTEYTIYHVTDDGVVTVLSTEVYEGGDINVNVDGFSYIGLSSDVDFVDVDDFKAQFIANPVTLYADTALVNSKEFATADTDIITIEMKAIVTDGDNVVELYVIAYNGYEGDNNEMKEAITPSSGMAYAYVMAGDVKEYVKPEEQPEEVVNAYKNLIKAATAKDFEEVMNECDNNGISDSFTDAQWSEIDRIADILYAMEEATEDVEEYGIEGTVTVQGSKLYLNPVTWPDEYVTVNIESIIVSLDADEVMAEHAIIEGEYTAENGDVYYVIDTSSWAGFAGKIPYKYINKESFSDINGWTKVDGKGGFLSDCIKIYNGKGTTYRTITDGLSRGMFDVEYSFFTDNGDGTVTEWYIIDTVGWKDANGYPITNKLVKQSDIKLITVEDITSVYNNILTASTVAEFNTLYAEAETAGHVDCFTTEQATKLAQVKATLETMAEATVDLSAYDIEGSFANEETKLYPNPVTSPDEYITAVVKPQTNFLSKLLSVFNFFLTANAAEGEEVTAQEVKIFGKYLDGDTLYYILDVSVWEGLPEGIDTLYVKASNVDIYVDDATQQTYLDLLSAQTKAEYDSIASTLDEKTLAVMTEAGLKDVTEEYAEVLEYLEANGTEVIADESVVGMYAQPIEGISSVYLYADPDKMTAGMTYYNLPSEEFKILFKIVEVHTDEFNATVYYKMNYSYPAKEGTEDCAWIRADSVEILEDFITEIEKLYLNFMQTETLEEWFAIEETLTETQMQGLESLEATETEALKKHFDALPSAIDKAKADSYNALMETTTVADYKQLFESLTDEVRVLLSGSDYVVLHDHAMELLKAEDTTPQNVIDYTNTAPLVIPDLTNQQIAPFNLRRSNPLATFLADGASEEETVLKDTDGVITEKNVVLKSGGIYTVTLDTYVTGSKVTTKVEKEIPTDIIIVVDQSGSMQFDMDKEITYDRINATALEIFNSTKYMNNTYVNVGTEAEPVYKKVTITAETTPIYILAKSLGHDTNSELYSHRENLFYKATETSTPVKVTVSVNNSRYSYSISGGALNNTGSNRGNGSPSFLDKLYILTDTINKVTFTYKDANENDVEKEYLPTDSVPKATDNIVGNTYYYRDTTTSEHRLDALVRALNNFAASVEQKAAGKDGIIGTNPDTGKSDDVNHRIAIVGFSSSVNTYHNTEILTGCDIEPGNSHKTEYGVYYPYGSERNGVMYNSDGYAAATRTALVDMNTTAGQTSVENAVKALTAHGGTQTNHGLDMAADIFAAEVDKGTVYTKTENGKEVTVRNKVVILFTDGSPTSSSGFENDVANSAIGYAKTIKNTYNATLYSIGIFDDADARVLISEDKTNAYLPNNLSQENRFMHFVSSNFKNADNMSTTYDTENSTRYDNETFHQENGVYTGKSYYLSASNSNALNNIFATISSEVENSGKVVELNEDTVIKDIVAPNFSVPADATNVTVRVDEVNTTTGEFKNNPQAVADVKASINGTDVNVTGFDFAENWVGSETAADGTKTYRGKKLIITFDIPVDEDFIGGNRVKTNGDASGVYDDTGALVENFTRPTVDIALDNIEAQWQNQHIYRTNKADIKALFNAATINGKPAAEVINGENNAYVDIVFTITGSDGEEIAKYTIDAGENFAKGGWNDEDKLTPTLDAEAEAEYTLSWIITPIYEGTAQAVSGNATAKVFVYDPILTYKDSTGYYGDKVPTVGDDNLVSTVWKNGNTLSTSVTMHGTEPELEKSYALGTGVTNNIITTKNDIPVKVTVKVDDKDITSIVDFEHQECVTDEALTSGAEFVIHVKTAKLTISKTVVAEGTDIPDDTFTFKVDQVWAKEFESKPVYYYDVYENNNSNPINSNVLAMFAGDKISLKHNQYAVLTGMPMGGYTVTESVNSKYETTVAGVKTNVATGTLSPDALTATVAFTNKLNTGDLIISKEVEMPTGFNVKADEEFKFTVTGPNGYSQNVTVKVDENGKGSVTIENLVQGSYTVVEKLTADQQNVYTADKISQTVTVNAGQETTAKVVNTAKTGGFSITKEIVNNAINYTPSDDETFEMQVTVNGYTGGALKYTIDGVEGTTDANGKFTLKADQMAKFENLLVGSTFTVAENLNTQQELIYVEEIDVASDKIVANTVTPVKVTNTVQYGSLTIEKIAGENTTFEAGETFIFTVTDSSGKKVTDVVIAGADSVKINNLLIGSYTVTEDMDWAHKYTSDEVSKEVEVTVPEGGTVTFTNTVKSDQWLKSYAYAENIFADVIKGGFVTTVKNPNIADN